MHKPSVTKSSIVHNMFTIPERAAMYEILLGECRDNDVPHLRVPEIFYLVRFYLHLSAMTPVAVVPSSHSYRELPLTERTPQMLSQALNI